MKRVVKWTIIVTIIVNLFLINISARPLYKDEVYSPEQIIVIGGDNYFPPFEFVDENGLYRGFNVDLIKAIALEMGLEVDVKPMPWYQVIMELETGGIHAIQGMKYSEERQRHYLFSKAYLESSQSIFVSADNMYMVDLMDLKNKKVAVQRNDISIDLLKDVEGVELVKTENQQAALRKLYEGDVDAYLGNRLTGKYSVQREGYQEDIKIVGEEINPEKYALATVEKHAEFLEIFNEGLLRIKEKGTYDTIYTKWFGHPISAPVEYSSKFLTITGLIFFISLLITFIFYKWNDLLKKEVERRTIELKKESNEKEQILNSVFSGLLTVDINGIIMYANQKCEAYLKKSAHELIGKNVLETPIKRLIDENDYYEVINDHIPQIGKEIHVQGDQDVLIYEYNINPLKIDEHTIYGATITFKNITEIKQMQDQLKVKDKLESLGRLTANIAHEIRNPLTAIKAYVELIPEKYHKEDFRRMMVEDVPKEIKRANDIISSLLTYTKPSQPQKDLCHISEILKEVVHFYSGEAERKGIHVKLQIEDGIYAIVDEPQFRQIIINLFLNAVQVLENTEKPCIMVKLNKNNDKWIVRITDNGPGIPFDVQSKIFDPFYTTKKQGSGLGLAVCYQFVKENNGDISVKSSHKEGTTFTITFQLTKIEEK
ncbi:transporter substrate-binding domain-containing protein [Tindallia magadiensis]|uniref:transporter substrate-binding domain-containing protein n=1 Tax=Tindallia magadiensis TaxID=69895 RepID=UPI000B88DA5B|nr:transporter substrate-binding domain-containing protein [Tindallia magadiensis]